MLGFVNCQSFLSLHNDVTRSGISPTGCPRVDTESCVRTNVSLDMIKNDDTIEMPDGTEFEVVSRDDKKAVFQVSNNEHPEDDNECLYPRLWEVKLSSHGREIL